MLFGQKFGLHHEKSTMFIKINFKILQRDHALGMIYIARFNKAFIYFLASWAVWALKRQPRFQDFFMLKELLEECIVWCLPKTQFYFKVHRTLVLETTWYPFKESESFKLAN